MTKNFFLVALYYFSNLCRMNGIPTLNIYVGKSNCKLEDNEAENQGQGEVRKKESLLS